MQLIRCQGVYVYEGICNHTCVCDNVCTCDCVNNFRMSMLMHVSKCMSDTVYVRYIRVCEWMYNHVNLSLSLFEYVHVSVYLCVCAQSSVLSDYLWLHVAYRAPPIHGIFQVRVLEWVPISFSRESSWPRDRTQGLNPGLLHCGQTL